MSDDEFRKQVMLTQLVEAWKDIRSYTSIVWQGQRDIRTRLSAVQARETDVDSKF